MENQKEEETKDTRFDFLVDAKNRVIDKQREGTLPVYLMLSVVIYNFTFFSIFPGYGVYIFVPVAMLAAAYYLKYWEQTGWRRITGIFLISISLLWDLVVSVSFIPGPSGYDLTSVPTLIVDIIGLISLILWYRVSE